MTNIKQSDLQLKPYSVTIFSRRKLRSSYHLKTSSENILVFLQSINLNQSYGYLWLNAKSLQLKRISLIEVTGRPRRYFSPFFCSFSFHRLVSGCGF